MAQRQTYRTMQGREIDLDKLRNRNETVLAVGNSRVNARGDEIGPGGKSCPRIQVRELQAPAGFALQRQPQRAHDVPFCSCSCDAKDLASERISS